MPENAEIVDFLDRHIKSIMENDLEDYHATTSEELTLYEWFVTPHRINGLPFHDFMMESNASRGTVFGTDRLPQNGEKQNPTRYDFANLHIQHYENTAIASYTLLISSSSQTGVQVLSHNESRVMVKQKGVWKVVHCHKSPAWQAPHTKT